MPRRGIVLSLLIAGVLSSGLWGQSAAPSADSYTDNNTSSNNYGSYPYLTVQSGPQPSHTANAYIRFDLGILPSNEAVSKATLRLFVNGLVIFPAPYQGSSSGNFDVYQLKTRSSGADR